MRFRIHQTPNAKRAGTPFRDSGSFGSDQMLDFGGPAASQAAICEPEGKDVTGRWVAASTLEPKARRAELVGRVLMWVGRLVISPSYTFRQVSQAPNAKKEPDPERSGSISDQPSVRYFGAPWG
jgi:hypothetical protein